MRRRTQLGLAAAAAAFLGLHATASPPLPDSFVGQLLWANADPRFGGLSAIEVSDDGTTFTAISDQSTLFTGHFQRARDGHIQQITDVTLTSLKGKDDQPLARNRNDSEGLAIAPDGTIYISQEGPARVLQYTASDAAARILPRPRAFDTMQGNSSLEALAIDANGWLYTMPERSGDLLRPFPVYRFRDGIWDQPFSIPRSGDYLAVGADFGPDGRLYVLERNFQLVKGFQSRIRRYGVSGDSIDAGETVLETEFGQHFNMEGLSVWRDATGALRLTMITDNNFRFFLATAVVEYRVPD
jgi:hypothetical protein